MNMIKKASIAIILVTGLGYLFLNCSNGNVKHSEETIVEESVKDEVIPDLSDMPLNLTSQTFNQAISNGIVLVDFWADWCPPCRVQGPIIKELADEVAEWAIIAKVDVDNNSGIANAYQVRNIPTLIIFKDGEVVRRFVGLQQKETLMVALKEFK